MATSIAVVGSATSGKTTGLRNLPPEETFIITPYKDNLPFRGANKNYKRASIKDGQITEGNLLKLTEIKWLPWTVKYINDNMPHVKYLVLEDLTHFFHNYTLSQSFREMGNDSKKTWSRWANFGADVYNALFAATNSLREDLYLINHYHTEEVISAHGESVKIKTPGKLLENQVSIDSYFEVVLYTDVKPIDKQNPQPPNERYRYVTNNDGFYPAKSPVDMFDDLYIPNDMLAVIQAIEAYREG